MNKELVHLQQVKRANRVENSTVLVAPIVEVKDGSPTFHPSL